MVCAPPRCDEVKNRCQCPNAWTEFLSRNARGEGKKSIKRHAAEYRRARDAGAFAKSGEKGLNDGPCKTNTAKLCTWRHRRKRFAHRSLPEHTHLESVRAMRAGKCFAHATKNPHITDLNALDDARRYSTRAFCAFNADVLKKDPSIVNRENHAQSSHRIERNLGLDKRRVRVGRIVKAGDVDTVFCAMAQDAHGDRGKGVVVKVAKLTTVRGVAHFEREVEMQKRANKYLRRFSANLVDAYVVKVGRAAFGVMIMEQADGTMQEVLEDGVDSATAPYLARRLKELVTDLRAASMVHGDLHQGNVAFRVVNGKPRPILIDFGRSIARTDDVRATDAFMVWVAFTTMWPPGEKETGYKRKMYDALIETGFPGSPMLARYCDGAHKPRAARQKWRASMFEDMFESLGPVA
jgi:tRNA A-37 threonylcarbamoyl transferase component Bud32